MIRFEATSAVVLVEVCRNNGSSMCKTSPTQKHNIDYETETVKMLREKERIFLNVCQAQELNEIGSEKDRTFLRVYEVGFL